MAQKNIKFSVHKIRTKDKYILTAWRIIYSNFENNSKGVVMAQHGLLDCSFTWFMDNGLI